MADIDLIRLARAGLRHRLSRVPAAEVHADFLPSGIAPRIGHALQTLAEGGTEFSTEPVTNLAEGILRTGDYGILPILADALDEAGHPMASAFDWRHAPRGIDVDRAVHAIVSPLYRNLSELHHQWWRQQTKNRYTPRGTVPRSAISRRTALSRLQEVIPDANVHDLWHGLDRLLDNDFIRYLSHDPELQKDHLEDTANVDSNHTRLLPLGIRPNPIIYTDTRTPPKQPEKLSRSAVDRLRYAAKKYAADPTRALVHSSVSAAALPEAEATPTDLDSLHHHHANMLAVYESLASDLRGRGHDKVAEIADYLAEEHRLQKMQTRRHMQEVGVGWPEWAIKTQGLPDPTPAQFEEGERLLQEIVDRIRGGETVTQPEPKALPQKFAKRKKSRSWVSAKIKKLMGEGKSQVQAVAEALNMAGRSRKSRYAREGEGDVAAFHRSIHENSEETLPARVYADYLEGSGKPTAAEVVRRHVQQMSEPAHDSDIVEGTGPTGLQPGRMRAVVTAAQRRLLSNGWLEKPHFSLTLHQRSAADPRRVLAWWAGYQDPETTLRQIRGLAAEGVDVSPADDYIDFLKELTGETEDEADAEKYAAYKAPAGGMVVRGVYYVGGSLVPDLAKAEVGGVGHQLPPQPQPKSSNLLKKLRARLRK